MKCKGKVSRIILKLQPKIAGKGTMRGWRLPQCTDSVEELNSHSHTMKRNGG